MKITQKFCARKNTLKITDKYAEKLKGQERSRQE